MRVKLSNDDRCAIDLVLEQRSGDGTVSEHCFGKSTASLQKRVKMVEQLFDLMTQMPAAEPPALLLARTLKYIQQHQHDTTARPDSGKAATVSHSMMNRPLQ